MKCSCNMNPATMDGPNIDCEVHGLLAGYLEPEPLVGELISSRPRLFKITDPKDETYVCYVPIEQITVVNVTDVGAEDEQVSFLVGARDHLVILDTADDVARFWEQWEIV